MVPLRYNVRSLVTRKVSSLLTAMIFALVSSLLFFVFSFSGSLKETILGSAGQGNWILLTKGVQWEADSYITFDQYERVRFNPAIQSEHGQGLISRELILGFIAASDNKPQTLSTAVRGVDAEAYRVHPNVRIERGRWPQTGKSEMAVGRRLAALFPNLDIGEPVRFGRRVWQIVGIFSDQGSARECEMWTDLADLQDDSQKGSGCSSIHLVVKGGLGDELRSSLAREGRLRLQPIRESDFYSDQAIVADRLRAMGLVLGMVLSIGAVFEGMNTMFSAISRRRREIGILRAIGFSRRAVVLSFLTESATLGLAGSVTGGLLSILVMRVGGLDSRLSTAGAYIFTFRASPLAFSAALLGGTMIGIIGGIAPAFRAALMEISASSR